ncbi:MAG: ABC transporter substrate-binding protein [Chloroflexota bacterium]
MRRTGLWIATFLVIATVLSACQTAAPATTPAATATKSAAPAIVDIILATTTSTKDSGLLDVLLPDFEKRTGYKVKPIAVGSGQAMTMGERGEADVLLVHAPASEVTFMNNGHGTERLLVMHNDFIVVGPKADPAGIKGMPKAADAIAAIAKKGALFASRGDNSGTNQLELLLWKAANITPSGAWYQSTGQGMGATLKIASEKDGYTITDRATYLATKQGLTLDSLVEGDPALLNIYHVIPVDPKKSDKINAAGGAAFAKYMVSPEAQALIKTYGADKYGQSLFFPDAGKKESDLGSQ